MPDKESGKIEIPVLRDVVVPVDHSATTPDNKPNQPRPVDNDATLLSSTLQQEVEAIITRARADFDATIERAVREMQQRVEKELDELHIHLTKGE